MSTLVEHVPNAARTSRDTADLRKKHFGRSSLLFVCGSLVDEAHRASVLGEALNLVPATLPDWQRFRGSDERIFARPMHGRSVSGYAIPVDQEHLLKADVSGASSSFIRMVAMVEVNCQRSWGFVFTRRGKEGIPLAD